LSSHIIHCARDWLARIIHSQLRLLAPRLDNENHTKDIDFTSAGIRLRWEAGYAHTMRALERRAWEDECDPLEGVILHEAEHA